MGDISFEIDARQIDFVMAHVVSGGDPNPLTRILQRFDLQPNAIAIATLPLGALSVEFVSFTEARDSPRVIQRSVSKTEGE